MWRCDTRTYVTEKPEFAIFTKLITSIVACGTDLAGTGVTPGNVKLIICPVFSLSGFSLLENHKFIVAFNKKVLFPSKKHFKTLV